MRKVLMKLLWLAPLAVIGALWFYPGYRAGRDVASAAVAPSLKRALPVEVYRVTPQRLEDEIKVNGSILPDEEAELRSELAGKITAIEFREGSRVTRGAVLVTINDAELKAERQRLVSEIGLASITERRQKNLLGKGNTSQENYDRALNRLDTLQAQLQLAEARLEKTLIRAPFDGIVGFRYVSEGSYVTANNPIATIFEIDPIKIGFAIPEKYAGKVAVDDRVNFTVPGHDEVFEGRVYAIEPRIDHRTRTLPIRALAPNPEEQILPGTFASVRLVFEVIEDALLIPTESLVPGLAGTKVFVAEDGVARERQVTVGLRTPRMIQVISGLQPGDEVIRTGILQVRHGLDVRITNASIPTGVSL